MNWSVLLCYNGTFLISAGLRLQLSVVERDNDSVLRASRPRHRGDLGPLHKGKGIFYDSSQNNLFFSPDNGLVKLCRCRGSSRFGGITFSNKEYFEIFLYVVLLLKAVYPRSLLDPMQVKQSTGLISVCYKTFGLV